MLEPFLRAYVGHLKPVITEGVAPGVALNWAVMPILAVVRYQMFDEVFIRSIYLRRQFR
jgi:hypothetical protein